ncbi:MAG TPA: hypothetical protein VHK24_15085 [Steroidobacter sp.]|nr:hypothetical protein [Steroidobacter sp.]
MSVNRAEIVAVGSALRRGRLARQIFILLAVKFLLLLLISRLFFGADAQPEITPAAVRDHLSPSVRSVAVDPARGEHP